MSVQPDDLRAYCRFGDLAEAVEHHEPTEYWKSGPYLFNFMERYKLKEALDRAANEGCCRKRSNSSPAPGCSTGTTSRPTGDRSPERATAVAHRRPRPSPRLRAAVDPTVAALLRRRIRLRDRRGLRFTKRLIFSGWALVPKVVSSWSASRPNAGPSPARTTATPTEYAPAGRPTADVPHRGTNGRRPRARRGRRPAPRRRDDLLPPRVAERDARRARRSSPARAAPTTAADLLRPSRRASPLPSAPLAARQRRRGRPALVLGGAAPARPAPPSAAAMSSCSAEGAAGTGRDDRANGFLAHLRGTSRWSTYGA